MLAFVKKLFLVLLLLVLLIFLYENMEVLGTKVPFVFDLFYEGGRYETPAFPVWILFAVFFLAGMITAGFHGIYERMARRVEIRRRDKRIRELEKEASQLRAQVAELRPPPASEAAPEREQLPAAPLAGVPDAAGRGPVTAAQSPVEEDPTL